MQFMIFHVLITDINALIRDKIRKEARKDSYTYTTLFVIFLFYVNSKAHF